MKLELLRKSREAALNAVQTFNNPLTTFKTETFIVLMVIAWMYLLHAYYRHKGVEYRYYEEGAKRLNYERYICDLFGEQHSLGAAAAFTLQFRDLNKTTTTSKETAAPLPSNITKYLQEFDAQLSAEDITSPYFRRRFLFVPMVTSKKAQADEVIQFVPLNSDLGKAINDNYQRLLLKEVERPKHLPGAIVTLMRVEGYTHFSMHHHTQLWKKLDGKNPGKGYGVLVAHTWMKSGSIARIIRSCTQPNPSKLPLAYVPRAGRCPYRQADRFERKIQATISRIWGESEPDTVEA